MAPIRFLLSALVVSSAIAAPINTNKVDSGEDAETLPVQHQSEPMRQADPFPSGTVDVAAMQSSAAAAAAAAVNPLSSGQEDNSASGMLDKLPRGYEWLRTRRQVDEVTKLLTELNHVGKRDVNDDEELEARQLGLVKSVPEAAGQIAHVLDAAESLPIKRQLGGALAGLGGVSGLLDNVKRDAEEADDAKKKPTYTEQALRGFLHKHEPAQDDKKEAAEAAQSLGLDVAKRGEADDATKKYTYTDDVVKSFLHKHQPAQDDKKEAAKTAQSLGLDVTKRGESDDATKKYTYTDNVVKSFLHKHEPAQDDKKEAAKTAQSIGLDINKRVEADDTERKPTYTEQALRGFLHKHEPAQDDKKKAAEAAQELGLDVAKRSEDAEARKPTYTEQALRGFLPKHEPAQDDAKEAQDAAKALGVDGLDGVAKRAEDADADKPTYTEQALRGFLHKHEPAQDDAKKAQEAAEELGVDVPNVPNGSDNQANDATKKPTYTEQALKGFFHNGPAQDDAKEAQEAASSLGVADGLDNLGKRDNGGPLGLFGVVSDLGIIGKRGSSSSGDPLGVLDTIKGLGIMGKRADGGPLAIADHLLNGNMIDDLGNLGIHKRGEEEVTLDEATVEKRDIVPGIDNITGELIGLIPVGLRRSDEEGALDDEAPLSKRQLGIVSSLATSGLSNAGAAAGSLAKVISGKRDDGNAESTTEAAMAGLIGMGMEKGKKEEETDGSDIAEQFQDAADAQNTGTVFAGHSQPPPGKGAPVKGSHAAKRQVPPIAGSDLLSITKGLIADPSKAVKPVTEGILVGGNSLEDLAQPK